HHVFVINGNQVHRGEHYISKQIDEQRIPAEDNKEVCPSPRVIQLNNVNENWKNKQVQSDRQQRKGARPDLLINREPEIPDKSGEQDATPRNHKFGYCLVRAPMSPQIITREVPGNDVDDGR